MYLCYQIYFHMQSAALLLKPFQPTPVKAIHAMDCIKEIWRFCLRSFFSTFLFGKYCLLIISDIWYKHSWHKLFTKLDIIKISTNIMQFCKYKYARLLMGLQSSPDIAQAIMKSVHYLVLMMQMHTLMTLSHFHGLGSPCSTPGHLLSLSLEWIYHKGPSRRLAWLLAHYKRLQTLEKENWDHPHMDCPHNATDYACSLGVSVTTMICHQVTLTSLNLWSII